MAPRQYEYTYNRFVSQPPFFLFTASSIMKHALGLMLVLVISNHSVVQAGLNEGIVGAGLGAPGEY